MPIVKLYSEKLPNLDTVKLSEIFQKYFSVAQDKVKIISVPNCTINPSGLFVEIQSKSSVDRTPPRMQECLKHLETFLSDAGYPGVMIRLEFFPAEQVFGVN